MRCSENRDAENSDSNHSTFLQRIVDAPLAKKIGTCAFLVFMGLGGCKVGNSVEENREKIAAIMAERIDGREGNEVIKSSEILPEDERSGKNLMVMASNLTAFSKSDGYRHFFETTFKTTFDILPDETIIHLMVGDDSREEALQVAREMFPHLRFEVYGLPAVRPMPEYAQDYFFPTGGFDDEGNVVLATSSCDQQKFSELLESPHPESLKRSALNSYGIKLFADEFLAKRYHDKFTQKDLPVRLEGGDLHITRLPNGKIALIVGPKNLTETIMYGIKDEYGQILAQSYIPDVSVIARFYEQARALYKKSFEGVDEVFFLGEGYQALLAINRNLSEIDGDRRDRAIGKKVEGIDRGHSEYLLSYGNFFFHLDMMLKTVTTPSGESVALLTEFSSKQWEDFIEHMVEEIPDDPYRNIYKDRCLKASEQEQLLMKLIRDQFIDLGYKIVSIPCGPAPTMNYTNSVVFKGEGGEKIAIVPQYGIPQDAEAVKAYESLGFRVLAPSLSPFIEEFVGPTKNGMPTSEKESSSSSGGAIARIGSLHCRIVTLGDHPKFQSKQGGGQKLQPATP